MCSQKRMEIKTSTMFIGLFNISLLHSVADNGYTALLLIMRMRADHRICAYHQTWAQCKLEGKVCATCQAEGKSMEARELTQKTYRQNKRSPTQLALPKQYQHTARTSTKHNQNSVGRSPTHKEHITSTSPTLPQNIVRLLLIITNTSPKHWQDTISHFRWMHLASFWDHLCI